MIDKKVETDIKDLKSFLELWMKFHSIYNDTISKGTITKDDESKFLETKGLIFNKYDELKKSLEYRYMPHARLTDPVNDILSLDGVLFMSEKHLRKLNEDWRDSYVFLNNILERLKSRKRKIEEFNPIAVFFKRFLKGENRYHDKERDSIKDSRRDRA